MYLYIDTNSGESFYTILPPADGDLEAVELDELVIYQILTDSIMKLSVHPNWDLTLGHEYKRVSGGRRVKFPCGTLASFSNEKCSSLITNGLAEEAKEGNILKTLSKRRINSQDS